MKSCLTALLFLHCFFVSADELSFKDRASKKNHYRTISTETQSALNNTSEWDYDEQILIYINHFKKVRSEVYATSPEYNIRGGNTAYTFKFDKDNKRLKEILSSGLLTRTDKRIIRNKLRVMRNRMGILHEKNVILGVILAPFEASENILDNGNNEDRRGQVLIGGIATILTMIPTIFTAGPMSLYTIIDYHHLIERDNEVNDMLRSAEKEMLGDLEKFKHANDPSEITVEAM